MTRHSRIAIGLLLAAAAAPAIANVVWPALYLETRLFSWWAIGAGLLIETLAYMPLFRVTFRRAAWYCFVANAASAIAGLLAIPLVGLGWEFTGGLLVSTLLGYGTFNPVTWGATILLGAVTNAVIESVALVGTFNLHLTPRHVAWLFFANLVTVVAAFVSILLKPVYM